MNLVRVHAQQIEHICVVVVVKLRLHCKVEPAVLGNKVAGLVVDGVGEGDLALLAVLPGAVGGEVGVLADAVAGESAGAQNRRHKGKDELGYHFLFLKEKNEGRKEMDDALSVLRKYLASSMDEELRVKIKETMDEDKFSEFVLNNIILSALKKEEPRILKALVFNYIKVKQ